MDIIHYLAYGSNLHPVRLRKRVPSSRSLGGVELSGYGLRFHKRGLDDSGKCDAFYTGKKRDLLYGAVYSMHADERPLLDRVESLGAGYHLCQTMVNFASRQLEVFFYAADPAYIDPSLAPYEWYKKLVVEGAKIHCLPTQYIQTIQATAGVNDPDQARANEHKAILNSPL